MGIDAKLKQNMENPLWPHFLSFEETPFVGVIDHWSLYKS